MIFQRYINRKLNKVYIYDFLKTHKTHHLIFSNNIRRQTTGNTSIVPMHRTNNTTWVSWRHRWKWFRVHWFGVGKWKERKNGEILIIVFTFHLSPFTFHLLPSTFHLLPFTFYLLPFTFYLLPFTFYLSTPNTQTTVYFQELPFKIEAVSIGKLNSARIYMNPTDIGEQLYEGFSTLQNIWDKRDTELSQLVPLGTTGNEWLIGSLYLREGPHTPYRYVLNTSRIRPRGGDGEPFVKELRR